MAEKEYIEREAAINKALEQLPVDWTMDAVEGALLDIPAADVEPVVRCRDCSRRSDCVLIDLGYGLDWYCADGKRKSTKIDGGEV